MAAIRTTERTIPRVSRGTGTKPTLRHPPLLVVSFYAALTLSGCSVGMAMSGKQSPDLGAIRVGSTRGEVELQLGSPAQSATLPEGGRVDIYEYEVGNEPSAGRAIGHGVMDVLTLGLWEVIGTPIEGFTGEKRRIKINYGPDDRVTAIGAAPPPPAASPAPAAPATPAPKP